MWNPETYDDADYGLAEGESFEPTLEEPEYASTEEPHVMTVLGPIVPEEVGICLPGVHLLNDPPGADEMHRLTDTDAAESEIEAFVTMNGRTLVEVTTCDAGRMIQPFLDIAGWVPAHLIAVTGRQGYQREFDNDLTEEFVRELTEGIDGTTARAGVIVVTIPGIDDLPAMTPVIRAAAQAQRQTGAPISVRVRDGQDADQVLQVMLDEGAATNQLILGNIDHANVSIEEHIRLAQAGAFLQFDQIGTSEDYTDQQRAERVVELYKAGFGDHILLSLDFDRRDLLVAYDGAPGLPYLSEWFMVLLMENGLTGQEIRQLVIDNPARALTIHPPL